MNSFPDNSASILDRVRPVTAPTGVVATHFIGSTAAFVLAEEDVLLVPPEGAEQRVPVHDGGILAAACDGARLVTTGDDGAVVSIAGDGTHTDARNRCQAALDRSRGARTR